MMEKFPERSFDVGISEEHAVTFAAGLAKEGLQPFCSIYSTFLQRGFDEVIHDVAIQNLPVTFCIDRAGLVGEDGVTHHGAFDMCYLRCIPNMGRLPFAILAVAEVMSIGNALCTKFLSGKVASSTTEMR